MRQRTRDFVGAVPGRSRRLGAAAPASTPAATSCATWRPARRCSWAPWWTDAWRYPGHEREVAPTLPLHSPDLDAGHAQATAQLRTLADGALHETRPALEPGARPVRAWRLLLAMAEHEVHHRSQLASYLTWMGVEPPDIFGLGVEDVERLTAHAAGRER